MPAALPIDLMTTQEKLQALEALWDSLSRTEQAVPVADWHKDLLDERERLVREGKAHFADWESVKRRISERTSS